MKIYLVFALLAASTALGTLPVSASADWRNDLPVFRIGQLGGGHEEATIAVLDGQYGVGSG